MQSIIEQMTAVSERHRERLALQASDKALSYAELGRLTAGIRQALGSADSVPPRIGVVTGDSVATYASILAIMTAGSAYVPLNRHNPADRNAVILEDAEVDLVLVEGRHEPLNDAASRLDEAPRIVDVSKIVPVSEPAPVAASVADSDLAYIFYTSGSTGKPKGVPIYHGNLRNFIEVMLDPRYYDFTPDDRFLQMFQLTFDLSVMSLFTPLCVGASCHVVPEKGIAYMNIARILTEHDVTVALMVPSVLAYLERFFGEIRLEKLRHSLFCGEALPQRLVEGWAECVPNARIQNVYGPTEATIYCLIYDWDQKQSRKEEVNGVVAIGTPMPRMEAFVVDDEGCIVADGERGELWLAGDQVTDQYWRNPEKTELAFVPHPNGEPGRSAYRTGDICSVNDLGNFVYCGRADHQIKIDGFRVELGEIEHHARECNGEGLVAVIAKQDSLGAMSLILFVEQSEAAASDLNEYLRTKLPPHMQPREVRFVETMPINQNGKIDRPALVRLLEIEASGG